MVALLLFINLIIQCFHFSISSPSQKNFHFSIVASKSDNTASKSNTHNRDNIFNSIGKLQNQLLQENMPIFSFQKDITIILKQVIEHSYFDDLIPIESLMHEYLGLLRDYYYDIFTKRLSETILDTESDSSSSSLSSLKVSSVYQQSIWIAYVETSQLCLLEFEVAKNSSLPNLPICSSWYTQGYLVELADDMKSYVASLIPLPVSISVENQSELGGSSHLNLSSIVPSTYINKRKVSWWTRLRRRIQQKHKRVAKYGKWLAVQILLFAINFGQNELNRHMSKRQAYKRHAEVPGFPLI